MACGPARPETPWTAATRAEINAVFEPFAHADSPGCALGILAGEAALTQGYGAANLEYGQPLAPDSVFGLASLSKSFTAMAVLLLVSERRLSLDDDVHKFIPELPDYGARITVRQLLDHTSGLPEYETLFAVAGRDHELTDQADALAFIARIRELNFAPGTQFAYNNTGFFLAAVIVERVAGKPLREFATQYIFAPIGMTSTSYIDRYSEVIPHRVTGYWQASDAQWHAAIQAIFHPGPTGVHSTINDLLRWEQNFRTGAVGGPRVLEPLQLPTTRTDGKHLNYALGFHVDDYRGLKRIWQDGGTLGAQTIFVRYPQQRTAVAILCNTNRANPRRLSEAITDIVLRHAVTDQRLPRSVPLSEPQIGTYVGTYWSAADGATAQVAFEGTALRLNGRALVPTARGNFWDGASYTQVSFERIAGNMQMQVGDSSDLSASNTYARCTSTGRQPAASEDIAGAYSASDLPARWIIQREGSEWSLFASTTVRATLTPWCDDIFKSALGTLKFDRDEHGKVTGVHLFARSIRRVRLVRAASPSKE